MAARIVPTRMMANQMRGQGVPPVLPDNLTHQAAPQATYPARAKGRKRQGMPKRKR